MTLGSLGQTLRTYGRAFFLPVNHLGSRQKWILGLINLAAVVIFWVSSSFLVNGMVEDDSYRKPFFITYVNTGCFCFYLIPYLRYEGLTVRQFIHQLKESYHSQRAQTVKRDQESLMRGYGSNEALAVLENTGISSVIDGVLADSTEEIGIYETVVLALNFIVLWFTANLVTNASLSYTSVASQTILSTTSSFFTLIIGYLYSIEKINQNKILGIILSFSGVLIVSKIDSATSPTADSANKWLVIWGNSLALLGALIYGVYTILLKFKITIPNSDKERGLNTHLFFGFVGVFCLVSLWPVLILLDIFEIEKFELPHTREITTLLLINALITFVSDFCWCKAVLLTSPLTVTVGLSMTIPLAMIGDWLIKGFSVNIWYLFGAFIVTLGFFIINKDEKDDFVGEQL